MVELGDKVKDPITGITGIAVCIHSYLHGCNRISVQQVAKKDGTVPDSIAFDEPQLVIVEKRRIPKGNNEKGGPDKYMPGSKTTGGR